MTTTDRMPFLLLSASTPGLISARFDRHICATSSYLAYGARYFALYLAWIQDEAGTKSTRPFELLIRYVYGDDYATSKIGKLHYVEAYPATAVDNDVITWLNL